MAELNTVVWLGIATIGTTALCAMTNMLLYEYNRNGAVARTVVPAAIVGGFGALLLVYVSFLA